MNNDINKQLVDDFKALGIDIEKAITYLPKIFDSVIPLSATGISPRTFFHWKKEGIIYFVSPDKEGRTWVRLNLFQYVWLMIVKSLRDFGASFELIKQFKEYAFEEMNKILPPQKSEFLEFKSKQKGITKEKLTAGKNLLSEFLNITEDIPEEDKIYLTRHGCIVSGIFASNEQFNWVIFKVGDNFDISFIQWSQFEHYTEAYSFLLDKASIQIPVRPIIAEFLKNPANEKFIERLNLLSKYEMKVLQAIRSNDFKEINIRRENGKEDPILEVVKERNITDEKVNEIRKILGLKEYNEIIIKLRNNKHIYLKNKTRIE